MPGVGRVQFKSASFCFTDQQVDILNFMKMRLVLLVLAVGFVAGCENHQIYVSPGGDDRGLGTIDSPLKTIGRAIQVERQSQRPVTICLSQGVYRLDAPLDLGGADHGITICARDGQQAMIDGGREIEGWSKTTVNGHEAWMAEIPQVAEGKWYFRELFVNGQRRPRPRLPKITGDVSGSFYRMERAPGVTIDKDGKFQAELLGGADHFIARPGDFQNWSNLADVDVVVLHYWVDERMPVASFDPQTRQVKCTRPTRFSLKDDWENKWPRYYIDNVFEAMTKPGEWYLNRSSGKLYYLPKPGESPQNTQIEAPRLKDLLRISDTQQITLRGLTFRNTDWDYYPAMKGFTQPTAGVDQSAYTLPAVITARDTHHLAIENCTLQNIGYFAIKIADGCSDCRIVGNDLHDLGAGAVHVNGGDAKSPPPTQTHDVVITDNHIHGVGRVFPSAAAILVRDAYDNTIAHNDVHDTYYSGISVGWVWGYKPNVTRGNLIEKNNLYDIGQGWLSDLGGIYTLGVQPGTIIRGNVIHDVRMANYGGWGIYLDEGSSNILVENNLCYDLASEAFHAHYGEDNLVRNNIFAFGGKGDPLYRSIIRLSKIENHSAFTLTRNILLSDGTPIYFQWTPANQPGFTADWNLIWNTAGPVKGTKDKSFTEWQNKTGNDRHSLIADPGFADHSFTLPPDSPAREIGFEPIDFSDVGPRMDHP